jgi:hypothetical protein
VAGTVIHFETRAASRHQGLRFTRAEKRLVALLGQIPGYDVSFESEDETDEWAMISAKGGSYTLVDLVRIALVPGGFRVVDGSIQPSIPFESIEEAVMTAWRAVWRRMSAFGLR